jgi:hypothetical protein
MLCCVTKVSDANNTEGEVETTLSKPANHPLDPTPTDPLDGPSSSTAAQAAPMASSTDVLSPGLGKWKGKRKSSDTEMDKTLSSIRTYITGLNERTSTASNSNMSEPDDEFALFGKLVTFELRKLKSTQVLRKAKKLINDVLFECQTEEEEQQLQSGISGQQLQYILLSSDT